MWSPHRGSRLHHLPATGEVEAGVGWSVVVVANLVGFTKVVPTVGGERGEGRRELMSNRYTVTTRMISALRWAAV